MAALGIANQRETTVVWDPKTGRPVGHAIVWQDIRTAGILESLSGSAQADRVREISGLPLSPYFAGARLRWMLEHRPGLRERAERGEVLFGTMDSWLIWNLTGGVDGG